MLVWWRGNVPAHFDLCMKWTARSWIISLRSLTLQIWNISWNLMRNPGLMHSILIRGRVYKQKKYNALLSWKYRHLQRILPPHDSLQNFAEREESIQYSVFAIDIGFDHLFDVCLGAQSSKGDIHVGSLDSAPGLQQIVLLPRDIGVVARKMGVRYP